ncbi:hypothetical protein H4582DRAFT_2069720 [Lactarius indigo]|nr:hypothetical protein H4582DRAFT_2069720 [Lactarius indigo]
MATPEYEVESILKAKVFMRGKKMGWKFYVKWKGYDDADNTWEPFKSFENSGEGIVDRFWERVDTKGRDVDSIEGWNNGEEVFPTGPPRMPPFIEPLSLGHSFSVEAEGGSTSDAKRPLQSPEPETPSKRKRVGSSRGRTGVRSTQRARRVSHTPVPDSQSEGEQMLVEPSSSPKSAPNDELVHDGLGGLANPDIQSAPPQSRRRGRPRRAQEPTAPQTLIGKAGREEEDAKQMVKKLHRILRKFSSSWSPPVRQLTAWFFDLVLRAQRFLWKKRSAFPLRQGSTNLTNHTGADDPIPPNHDDIQPSPSTTTFELPDKMPTSISFPGPSSGPVNPWKRATIFGPLAIGAGLATWVTTAATETGLSSTSVPKPFPLSLDNSTTVPVTLKDVAPAQTSHILRLENIVSGTHGPPGKLYKSHAATALLETLETGGSCARLALDETATAEQRRVFDAFRNKLEEGGLFVVMANSEVLACCSSTNDGHTKKLALTPSLEGLSDTVVVSHVKVVNYSAFADAAALAENVRW